MLHQQHCCFWNAAGPREEHLTQKKTMSSSSDDDEDWGGGDTGPTTSSLTKLTDVHGHEMTDEMWEREVKQKELAIGIYDNKEALNKSDNPCELSKTLVAAELAARRETYQKPVGAAAPTVKPITEDMGAAKSQKKKKASKAKAAPPAKAKKAAARGGEAATKEGAVDAIATLRTVLAEGWAPGSRDFEALPTALQAAVTAAAAAVAPPAPAAPAPAASAAAPASSADSDSDTDSDV